MIATRRFEASDGASVGVRLAQGSPAHRRPELLLFVHGVGSTAAIWDAQLEAFGGAYRCAAVELRGNGACKPDPEPALITRAGFARDVETVLDALGVQRCVLVGCSLGGVVAFELWSRVPNRIGAMALLGSFARYPDGQRYADGVAAAARAAGTMRRFAEGRAAQLGLPPARVTETVEQMACKSLSCYLAATQATWTGDYRALLPSIDVPALVAYGERDAVAPRPLAAKIAAGIAAAELVEIPGAGHVANADDPGAFNALLERFLAPLR